MKNKKVKKNLFLFFHLNMFFSSIKESDRLSVIKKCYWPILEIAEKNNIKIGLEISGQSLEVIKKLDIKWIKKIKSLIKRKLIFIMGSGYSQMIGPLVPYKLNNYNYKIGNEVYKKILNIKPNTLLINEHSFSKSLIDIIKKNHYNSIVMEWENSITNSKLLNENLKFQTVNIKGYKYKLRTIWNSSLNFQKFQKYIYDKISLDNYLNFIKKLRINKNQFFVLYGSDAEVFNFRPKKTDHNKVLNLKDNNEWKKIENLLILLKKKHDFLSLDEILKNRYFNKKTIDSPTNAKFPCTTKKQPKYNITRWALTGINDFKINTNCFKIYDYLIKNKIKKINDWKKLCYFWSSDFRTHIDKKRWINLNNDFLNYNKKIDKKTDKKIINLSKKNHYIIEKQDKILVIKHDDYKFGLNLEHGLSLEYYYNYSLSDKALIGMLEQGFYKNKNFNADFYSGHLISEFLNKKNITDLSQKIQKPKINKNNNLLEISFNFKIMKTLVKKKWIFNFLDKKLSLEYIFSNIYNLSENLRHSLITLNPNNFQKNSLFFSTHNGGNKLEKFNFKANEEIDHLKRVSHITSSTTCQGMTEGIFEIGDKNKKIVIEIENKKNALIPFIQYFPIKNSYFYRLIFSSKEHDETSLIKENYKFNTRINISSKKSK